MPEARLKDSGSCLAPAGDGWFVVNVRDAEWWTSETFDSGCRFESGESWFSQFGINLATKMRALRELLQELNERLAARDTETR